MLVADALRGGVRMCWCIFCMYLKSEGFRFPEGCTKRLDRWRVWLCVCIQASALRRGAYRCVLSGSMADCYDRMMLRWERLACSMASNSRRWKMDKMVRILGCVGGLKRVPETGLMVPAADRVLSDRTAHGGVSRRVGSKQVNRSVTCPRAAMEPGASEASLG